MSNEFGRGAIQTADGVTMTSEQRLNLALVDPSHPLALSPKQLTGVTKARLRHMLADLVAGNMEKVNGWLDDLAKEHPRAAIECLIELAKFTTPQQKAVAVDIRDNGGNLKSYSVAQLEAMLTEGSVVSEQ